MGGKVSLPISLKSMTMTTNRVDWLIVMVRMTAYRICLNENGLAAECCCLAAQWINP